MFGAGNIYLDGLGVKQDAAKAAEYYRRAADLGNASAQFQLGRLYMRGLGVKRDLVSAYMWFLIAGAEQMPYGLSYTREVSSEMSTEEIARAQAAATQRVKSHPKEEDDKPETLYNILDTPAGPVTKSPSSH